MKRWCTALWIGVLVLGTAWAQDQTQEQSLAQTLDQVRQAQDALARQLEALKSQEQQASQACWQRFAVNDCLAQVRRQARQAREPLRAQLLALQSQERELKLAQREQRLQER